jgi:DnaJ-class molecular chaperone
LAIIKKISLLEALTGVTIQIEHLDGQKYTIATAPGEVLSNMELKTIKNLGMPFYKDGMSNGHLYIEFLVDFPPRASLNPEKQEKLKKILGGM